MAVVNRKSGVITNRDASPPVRNNLSDMGAVKMSQGTLETVSGDDIASTYRVCRIPSNAVVHTVRLYCDDIGTTTIADIGIYKNAKDGGAVVDADFFGSAVSLKDGAVNGTDVTHESGAYDLNEIEQPLWQALGLSSDPGLDYDVVFTLTAASDGAATVALRVLYS